MSLLVASLLAGCGAAGGASPSTTDSQAPDARADAADDALPLPTPDTAAVDARAEIADASIPDALADASSQDTDTAADQAAGDAASDGPAPDSPGDTTGPWDTTGPGPDAAADLAGSDAETDGGGPDLLPDAVAEDAGPADASPTDASPADASPADASPADASPTDVPPDPADVPPDSADVIPCAPCGPGETCIDGTCQCTQPCSLIECGLNACGEWCGDCADGFECSPENSCVALPGPCPPQPPFGTKLGDVVPDLAFLDCDGNVHTLHDLCPKKVAWIFVFEGW